MAGSHHARRTWEEEFKQAIASVKDLPVADQFEAVTRAVGKTQFFLLPRAYLRVAQILNCVKTYTKRDAEGNLPKKQGVLATPAYLDMALSFMVRMQELYLRNARWLIERDKAKAGESFPGFGGMQPLLDAGTNGNGHKSVIVEPGVTVPDMKDVQEVEIQNGRF